MPPDHNPYDFLNTPDKPKRTFAATTQKGRIIQVAVIAAVFLVVFGLVFGLIFSKDTGPKKPLLELSAAQADLIDVTVLGEKDVRDAAVKTQSEMIHYTVLTHSSGTTELLKSYGVSKNLSKQIAPYRDTSYIATLKKSTESNTFDETYKTILSDKIGNYRSKLRNAYNAAESQNQKTELASYFSQLDSLAPATTN